MRPETGFTLIEVLIALIIAAMATVAAGMLIAGTGRVHTETRALETAAVAGDGILELMSLFHTPEHPELRSAITALRKNHWTVTLNQVPEPAFPDLSRVELRLDHADLRRPVILTRLIRSGLPSDTPPGDIP